MNKNAGIVIIGAGAQAKYACEIFHQSGKTNIECVIASDRSNSMDWPLVYGAQYLVGYDYIENCAKEKKCKNAIICVADIKLKQQLEKRAIDAGFDLVAAIHPNAHIASTASIEAGVIINAGAVIQPFSKIGRGVMIHANVIVEHDCDIADYANLAPGVSLAGWVKVGRGATIFTGASVIPSCEIGENAIVAAGAAVISDVKAGTKVAGVPAKLLNFGSDPLVK